MSFIEMKPGTLLAPVPTVMVSCAAQNISPNIITIAWAGTVNSDPPLVSVSIQPKRYSHDIVRDSGEFVINLVSRQLLKSADLCGVRSGRDGDKFELCGLHPVAVEGLRLAPAIAESPIWLACQVRQSLSLGTHTMFIGEIVNVGVAEDLVDRAGKINFTKADLIAYCHGEYMGLTKPEGFFGFSIARPDVLKRRLRK